MKQIEIELKSKVEDYEPTLEILRTKCTDEKLLRFRTTMFKREDILDSRLRFFPDRNIVVATIKKVIDKELSSFEEIEEEVQPEEVEEYFEENLKEVYDGFVMFTTIRHSFKYGEFTIELSNHVEFMPMLEIELLSENSDLAYLKGKESEMKDALAELGFAHTENKYFGEQMDKFYQDKEEKVG